MRSKGDALMLAKEDTQCCRKDTPMLANEDASMPPEEDAPMESGKFKSIFSGHKDLSQSCGCESR